MHMYIRERYAKCLFFDLLVEHLSLLGIVDYVTSAGNLGSWRPPGCRIMIMLLLDSFLLTRISSLEEAVAQWYKKYRCDY